MRRTITSMAVAAIAVLVVTASVAAADPFGWGRHAATSNQVTSGQTWDSTGWSQAGVAPSQGTAANPVAVTRPAATSRPRAVQVKVQTDRRRHERVLVSLTICGLPDPLGLRGAPSRSCARTWAARTSVPTLGSVSSTPGRQVRPARVTPPGRGPRPAHVPSPSGTAQCRRRSAGGGSSGGGR